MFQNTTSNQEVKCKNYIFTHQYLPVCGRIEFVEKNSGLECFYSSPYTRESHLWSFASRHLWSFNFNDTALSNAFTTNDLMTINDYKRKASNNNVTISITR